MLSVILNTTEFKKKKKTLELNQRGGGGGEGFKGRVRLPKFKFSAEFPIGLQVIL